jgi:RNA polymerase-binding transcription factor DksA
MARAGASKSLQKPAPRARGASEAGTPTPVKATAKTTAKTTVKKAAEPAAAKAKAPAKAVKTHKAGKAGQVAKVSKPAPSPAKAVKAVKAVKPAVKAVKPVKAAKATPVKTVAKAKSPTVARNTSPKKSPEVVQVAEAKGKRGGAATKAPPAAAAVPEKIESADFSPKTLDKLRRLLEEERETYVRQAHDLAAEAEALASDREPGDTQFDEESGEGDTLNVERERDLALSASATQAVEEIDRALRRMDIGSFGICERCGKKIAVARLEALPFAALCIECKSREERRR